MNGVYYLSSADYPPFPCQHLLTVRPLTASRLSHLKVLLLLLALVRDREGFHSMSVSVFVSAPSMAKDNITCTVIIGLDMPQHSSCPPMAPYFVQRPDGNRWSMLLRES